MSVVSSVQVGITEVFESVNWWKCLHVRQHQRFLFTSGHVNFKITRQDLTLVLATVFLASLLLLSVCYACVRPKNLKSLKRNSTWLTPLYSCVSYGHMVEDSTYESVHHLAGCTLHQCFAFDFDFTSNSAFERYTSVLAALCFCASITE